MHFFDFQNFLLILIRNMLDSAGDVIVEFILIVLHCP